jgi:predicted ATPase
MPSQQKQGKSLSTNAAHTEVIRLIKEIDQPPADNNWYVITGAPHSGKTMLVNRLSELGYRTLPESARMVIDESIKNGVSVDQLKTDPTKFQYTILQRQIELEKTLDPAETTFLDRGMHGNLAYMIHMGVEIDPTVDNFLRKFRYKKVFLLDIVPGLDAEKDYARTEDYDTALIMDALIDKTYRDYGMQPIRIPAVSVDDRISMVLDIVKQKH